MLYKVTVRREILKHICTRLGCFRIILNQYHIASERSFHWKYWNVKTCVATHLVLSCYEVGITKRALWHVTFHAYESKSNAHINTKHFKKNQLSKYSYRFFPIIIIRKRWTLNFIQQSFNSCTWHDTWLLGQLTYGWHTSVFLTLDVNG